MPSNVSVNSAVRKMIKAASGVPPAKARISRAMLKINRDKVSKSAKYLMVLLYHNLALDNTGTICYNYNNLVSSSKVVLN